MSNKIRFIDSSIQIAAENTLFHHYELFIHNNNLSDKIGVIDSSAGCKYSYREIISDSNALAKYIFNTASITSEQTTPNHDTSLIAILSEKGYNQVISALAIMKSGYAYLPLNVAWPLSRIDDILIQGNVKILLISKQQSVLPEVKEQLANKYILIVVEDILSQLYSDNSLVNQLELIQLPLVEPGNPAYVIFTSGSTGTPKGVTITHRSALNTIIAVNHKYMVNSNDAILALSELSFDLSVYDIFGLLAAGGIIVFPQQNKLKNPLHWLELIEQYNITLWNTVPQLAELLIDELEYSNFTLDSLRLFLLSGDKIPINLPDTIRSYWHNAHIVSLGGATECSIWSIWYDIASQSIGQAAIPYGVAMPNQTIYILNEFLEIISDNKIGEIYIGGAGLALNYYGDTEKTEFAFISHDKLGRLYKTGDLGCWHENGYVEFKGRKDNQVKILGSRVELGEIESKLCLHPEIKQAIVCFKNQVENVDNNPTNHSLTNHKYLVAYYVLENSYLNNKLNNVYIQNWTDVYNNLYSELSLNNYAYNTCGWNSSYTLQPIPKVEVKEFIDSTLDRIASLNPKNILEIGCGTGILLFNLLNTCNTYVANDFSTSTIDHLNKIINTHNLKNKVCTICCNAHEIDSINSKYKFDTVIINSVIQYFPSINYLITVLGIVISQMDTVGKIFIGDVRDYRLLKLFHFSVLSYKQVQPHPDLINEYSLHDKELLISPEFFIYCKTIFKEIKHIEILPKNGKYDNEINCFRYDVVLHVNSNSEPKIHTNMQFISTINIVSILQHNNRQEIFVKYPNSRIYKDYLKYNELLNIVIENNNDNVAGTQLLSIEDIHTTAKQYNYNLKILLDIDNPILLNLIFYKNYSSKYYNDDITPIHTSNVVEMANDPLQNLSLTNEVIADSLEKFLLTQLPEYMVPKHYIQLSQMPLTFNGKIDYSSLPPVQSVDNHIHIKPTRNNLENKIVTLWSDVLKLPKNQIGIEDNFFKLGGNSLLITILRRNLATLEEFKNIKVVDLFKYPTIQQLSNFVTQTSSSASTIKLTNNSVHSKETDIAIISISGAFSGGENVDEYWELIKSGNTGLSRHTIEECRNLGIAEHVLKHPNFIPVTGKTSNTNSFDAEFWKMKPAEIHKLDPQIRKFLEHCWYVLENSGYLLDRTRLNIGVFAGGRDSPHLDNNPAQFTGQGILGAWGSAGNLATHSTLAMQVSYMLGLTGVAHNIDTACSTSLVAIIEACKNLANGYCDMALAGGVSLILPNEVGYIYKENHVFAKDGQLRAFDRESSGMVSGSGVGVVLLKPLSAAQRDNDNIIAVIKGYAVNNDGNRKMSYTAPSVVGQAECIVNAQKMAGIFPDEISYVECHGSGTKLGDTIEIQALSEAFKYNSRSVKVDHKCDIGSVKANIGHAELASGVAGLIKVCKMLEYNIIPGQINFNKPNPNLNLDETPFVIPTATHHWLNSNQQHRFAGVSSFGIGGTNAHIIISDYISEKNGKCADDGYHTSATNLSNTSQENAAISYILPLSAKSKSSLVAYREYFIKYLTNTADCLANIAYTLQLKRESYIHRTAIVANSIDDAIEKFSNVKTSISVTVKNEAQNIIFMFPGQGTQYPDMTVDLYQYDKDYQVILDNCLLIINKHVNIDFKHILFPSLFANENKISEDSITQINKTQWAQLALFSVSYALAKWLEKLNINASAYLGHSIGELVAATLSGVFSLNDAIKLVVTRGTLMQNMVSGSMLHIQANADAITKLTQENHCEIAVINSPQQCVISGTLDNISKIKSELDKMAIPAILLKVSHGYHSYLMEEAAKQFANEFAKIKLYPPKQPFVSNITGDFINANDAINPNYWSQHIRQKVQFAAGIQTIYNHFNNPFFIQVGPGKELLNFVKQSYPSNTNGAAIISKPSNTYNFAVKNEILSKLWVHGCALDFSLYLDKQRNYNMVRLPRYYFDRKPYIFQPNIEQFVTEKNDILQKTTSISWRNIADQVVEIGLPEQYYTIAAIFLQLLDMDKISVHDDFFALGGDSISAIILITQLKNIGINLTLSNIIHTNSVAKIYKFANDINNKITNKIIMPLLINNFNQNKKIFLIHPVGGTIIRYLNIVRSLNNQYDYYGIQNINIFNPNSIKADTLEELSTIYLNEILQIQDSGEYILMGSSLGGNIAYEIASQLTKLGKTVKFIAMFDAWAKYFNETTYTDDNLETISKLQAENIKTTKNSGTISVYDNIIDAGIKLLKLALKYEPQTTKLKIYLFKAEELSSEYIKVENSYDNGWQKHTDTVMSIYNIPGNHDSIHLSPGIEEMVKLLQGVLD
ncbi:MAG: hypothetical protein QG673_1639 [Pseudomonadota bacterium]|nr:hypothetical protein [Pseudomonadota bacterium]